MYDLRDFMGFMGPSHFGGLFEVVFLKAQEYLYI